MRQACAGAVVGVSCAVASAGLLPLGGSLNLMGTTLADSPEFGGSLQGTFLALFEAFDTSFSGEIAISVFAGVPGDPLANPVVHARVVSFNDNGNGLSIVGVVLAEQVPVPVGAEFLSDSEGDRAPARATFPAPIGVTGMGVLFDFDDPIQSGETSRVMAMNVGGITGLVFPADDQFTPPGIVFVEDADGTQSFALFSSVGLLIPTPGIAVTLATAGLLAARRRR